MELLYGKLVLRAQVVCLCYVQRGTTKKTVHTKVVVKSLNSNTLQESRLLYPDLHPVQALTWIQATNPSTYAWLSAHLRTGVGAKHTISNMLLDMRASSITGMIRFNTSCIDQSNTMQVANSKSWD